MATPNHVERLNMANKKNEREIKPTKRKTDSRKDCEREDSKTTVH